MEFEFEQILPGHGDPDHDDAMELRDRGDAAAAIELLGGLLERDARCLDAYAHLGLLALNAGDAQLALGHYAAGVQRPVQPRRPHQSPATRTEPIGDGATRSSAGCGSGSPRFAAASRVRAGAASSLRRRSRNATTAYAAQRPSGPRCSGCPYRR